MKPGRFAWILKPLAGHRPIDPVRFCRVCGCTEEDSTRMVMVCSACVDGLATRNQQLATDHGGKDARPDDPA